MIVLMSLEDEIRRRRCRRLRQRGRQRCAEGGPGRRAGRRLLGRQRRDTGIIPLSVRVVVVGGPADSGGVALAGDAFSHADAARRAVEIAFHIARLARPAVAVPAEASRAALDPGRGRLSLLLLLLRWRSSYFYCCCCCCCRHRRGHAVTADSVPGHGGGAGGRSRLADPGRHVDKTGQICPDQSAQYCTEGIRAPSSSPSGSAPEVSPIAAAAALASRCRQWELDRGTGTGARVGNAARTKREGNLCRSESGPTRNRRGPVSVCRVLCCAVLCSACWSAAAAAARAVQGLSWGTGPGEGESTVLSFLRQVRSNCAIVFN